MKKNPRIYLEKHPEKNKKPQTCKLFLKKSKPNLKFTLPELAHKN